MSTEEKKAIERRVIEEIFNQKNLSAMEELIDPNFTYHGIGRELNGYEGFKQFFTMTSTAFPDFHVTIEDLIAEGDKVVNRMTVRGTFTGEMMGTPTTGKQFTITQIAIIRFVDGKVVEVWEVTDRLDMFQQLGIIPPMGPPQG
jgi:steroid delta-isomerase-like uncharacterized protein